MGNIFDPGCGYSFYTRYGTKAVCGSRHSEGFFACPRCLIKRFGNEIQDINNRIQSYGPSNKTEIDEITEALKKSNSTLIYMHNAVWEVCSHNYVLADGSGLKDLISWAKNINKG